jgi:oligopeptide transport system substrate-binding protein
MKPWLAVFLVLAATSARAETILNRGNGAEPDTLDPAFASTAAETNILGDMMVGLTTLDAAARPVPGIADHWETSRDDLTWTFHLRRARWSDGSSVTAQDFISAWRRLLDPKTAARAAANLWIIKNARAVTAGRLPVTALGVGAPDPATVVITLENPAPWLPELLTQPCALPLPPAALKSGPHPNNYVSDGPYRLKSWNPNDHITLIKNSDFHDAVGVKIETVNYFPTADSEAALRRLRARELDRQTPLPSAELAWMRANMPGALHIMPSLALAYIAINLRDPALADIRVRRALNLVYDREAVAGKVMKLGERPAYAFVPPNVANYAGGPELDFKAMTQPAR